MIRVADLPATHPGRRLLTKRSPFFVAPRDPRCSYSVYVPTSWTPDSELPVLVAVHGTGRSVGELREGFIPFAEEHGVIVVVPLFPVGLNGPDDVDNYKTIDSGGVRFDLVVLDILEEVRHRWHARTDRVLLCGHSGGGQFANRFLFLHPDRVIAVAVGAPGSVTVLDEALDWPEGIADTERRFGIPVDPAAVARIPVLLVVGSEDDGRADLAAMGRAGRSRPEELSRLRESLAQHGSPVRMVVVPGVGHSAPGTRAPVVEFLTTQLAEAGVAPSVDQESLVSASEMPNA
ncbi:alpha/beta hydrolase [Amycolatopsis sacchari]|uniref:Esterase PHB depolymerase n=1 Tax=Amycolatopsis sacchari TaxID=115433 RepID=A0A1I3VKU4_9PSEU|nr:alpha/beta hydrolase [Amycolatopsis sacchari]SFJ94936.1 Esterase PHB depolymerase [Amycolatopsis sacchari]